MPRRRLLPPSLALLLLLAAVATAEAQTGTTDLAVTIALNSPGNQPARARIGEQVSFTFRLANHGSSAARDVVLDLEVPGEPSHLYTFGAGISCNETRPFRCTAASLSPGQEQSEIFLYTTLPATAGTVTARATVTSSTTEINPANNTAALDVQVLDLADLRAAVTRFDTQVDPGQEISFAAEAINFTLTPAHDVVLRVTLPSGGTITRFHFRTPTTADCSFTAAELVCRKDTLTNSYVGLDVFVAAPPRLTGGNVTVHAEASSSGEDFNLADNVDEESVVLVKQFLVENTADEGSGSLRQALLDARAGCASTPCTVVFRLPAPVPPSGWFTIQPLSALPEAGGYLHIDGSTQTAVTGDTNPDGPEVEINGALAGDASGLAINAGCDLAVIGLAINGFARDGVDVISSQTGFPCGRAASITDSYLGTDPRGRTAVPNERGIVSIGLVSVTRSILSGNRRSGLFSTGPGYASISSSRIGVGTNGTPLGNGASGIFLNHCDGLVSTNVIANNLQWGMGRTYGDEEVGLYQNSIFGNGVLAYDIGLDFETANSTPDNRRPPNKPVLFSASYDSASGSTTVRGRLDSDPRAGAFLYQAQVQFFSSQGPNARGYVEAESYIGQLSLTPSATHTDLEFVVQGDLRGRSITANFTRSRIDTFSSAVTPAGRFSEFPSETSELSNGVPVQ